MKLCKLRLVFIDQIDGKWYVLGKGHHYNPEGFVYLWPGGDWCSLANAEEQFCYRTREQAETALAVIGLKEGFQYEVQYPHSSESHR